MLLDLSRATVRKRLACEIWRAAAAMAERLWLTTKTLCPSRSGTNAQ